ncbi:cysteine desulfurase [Tepidiforma thermophila]|uniref:cysteine desulfurase n=1 Tax=Tepidiforma thermophila (strain KCTC 52669 / CGMCC 1.13589 / G233) TaxID=2761530 RepID=A0A2A9HGB6_TEPT2|nr:cysteine desulfurase [Tepidiforma thermophila]PFG74182.1 cysteine desulfurase/L-selenocysteine selenide-lyase (L-alanine-forming) [Tepidiforma thermophila]
MLDVRRIRQDFPILRQQVNGRPLVYLDNAATTQKPRQVIEALVRYYETSNANIHRGIHTLATRATEQYEDARRKVARFIGARGPEEVVFTRNATEAINLVARAWGDEHVGEGDEIVLTLMEHHSNIVPWQLLARRKGATLRYAGITGDGNLDLDELRRLIGPRTKLVAVTHMSNVLGTINPVADIAEMAHAAGALLLVDGAQSVPHLPVDVQELGADFLAFSAHKMLGPTGVGVLWARAELLEAMPPFLGGGDMIAVVRPESSTWAELPHKFEAGTPNIADVIAFGAAVDYLADIGMANVRRHEEELTELALERLRRVPGLRVFGPAAASERGGVVSFSMEAAHPHDVATIADGYGVAIRAGHHCAQLLMRALGVPATSRASFSIYNGADDIEALVEALEGVNRVFGEGRERAAVR